MKNNTKLLITLFIMIVGWLMSGFGFTTKLGHPISTICFLLGFSLIIIGIIFFIKIVKEQ